VAIQATEDDIRALVKRYPPGHRLYRNEDTLAQRKRIAEKFPAGSRNRQLSFTSHAEVAKIRNRDARLKFIADAPIVDRDGEEVEYPTVQQVAEAVLKVRRQLGEVRTPKPRREPGAGPDLAKMNRSQGFSASDQQVFLVHGQLSVDETGKVTISIDHSAPGAAGVGVQVLGQPEVQVVAGGSDLLIYYRIGEEVIGE
jgi:hypothetical protein